VVRFIDLKRSSSKISLDSGKSDKMANVRRCDSDRIAGQSGCGGHSGQDGIHVQLGMTGGWHPGSTHYRPESNSAVPRSSASIDLTKATSQQV
jgi:hypothetical protein